MGESVDNSTESDEYQEAKERFEEFGIGQSINKSRGFSSKEAEDKYIERQNELAKEKVAEKISTMSKQDFAREQDFFDANPYATVTDALFTSGSPSFDSELGAGYTGLRDSVINQIALGGKPVINDGRIVGVMGDMRNAPAFGMLPTFMQNLLPNNQVYTGIAEFDPNRFTSDNDNTSNETTSPVMNQMTGKSQCPEGYVFDNDLQACRLKTRTDDEVGTPKDPPEGGGQMFVRNYSLLNQAPMNVPQGFDYNAMNTNFMNRFGTRPSIFKNPPNLLGFTPFGG